MFRSFVPFLSSLFRRDGLDTIRKIGRYAFSRKAWSWLRTNIRNKQDLKASGLVDEAWYRREYPDVAESGIDPVQDFLTPPHPWIRMPNPDFVPREYAAVNFDVKASGLPWAVHYARDGMREGRPVSTLENYEKPFPPEAVELRREFAAAPAAHRRTAVFASFSGDGRIGDAVLFYLRGLREVADNVVFVANNPVFPDEAAKLDGLVRLAVFRHHGCYDFGSYKIGWNEAKALGLLEPEICDELVVCNDSCYGPVFPFSGTFAEMDRRNREVKPDDRFDFWGMTAHELFERPHVQSFFYVFGKAVLEGRALDRFFDKMEEFRERGQVVFFCETAVSAALAAAGHRFSSLVPEIFSKERDSPPIKFPVTMLSAYRMPLIKAKTLKGESKESLAETLEIVRRENPGLARLLPSPPERTAFEETAGATPSVPRAAREIHVDSMRRTADGIRAARAGGRPVRVRFFKVVTDLALIGPVLGDLLRDKTFSATIAAVPDFRIEQLPNRFSTLRDVRTALLSNLPRESVVRAESDSTGEWFDLTAGADVVCWETAEDASDFRYNPHYAVGRDFLPVLLFDRRTAGPYPLEKEFARQNYAYFWRIFFADREAFDLYAKHSIRGGENAVFANDLADSFLRLLSFA